LVDAKGEDEIAFGGKSVKLWETKSKKGCGKTVGYLSV